MLKSFSLTRFMHTLRVLMGFECDVEGNISRESARKIFSHFWILLHVKMEGEKRRLWIKGRKLKASARVSCPGSFSPTKQCVHIEVPYTFASHLNHISRISQRCSHSRSRPILKGILSCSFLAQSMN